MTADEVRTLYAFNRWATGRLLDATRRLAPPDFTRDLRTSYRSVRGTLVHLVWAEWIWLRRWRGESPTNVYAEEEFADADAVATRWRDVERDQRDFLATLTDDRLPVGLAYRNLKGERWEYPLVHTLQHVANHSSYHRGQVVTLLRQLGHAPPPTDFLVFFDEGRG
ncbi:MAG: DinB family protein [Gemmatimonadales bacterium]